MAATDPRIDAYITKSAEFAKPILEHLRRLVHKGCPDTMETIKWSMPFFEYNGAILCHMASFKQHCSFGFWKARFLKDPEGILHVKDKNAMGHLDRITSLKDLPSDKIMLAFIREAVLLNQQGIKMPARLKKVPKKPLPMPAVLVTTLKKNKKAQAAWEAFSPSHRREYIEWITEAKSEETRDRRLATTLEWLAEGKSRHWKHQKQ